MSALNRKGHTEDYFSDLIPAIIIIVITLFVIANFSYNQNGLLSESSFIKSLPNEIKESYPLAEKIHTITLLKSPYNKDSNFLEFFSSLKSSSTLVCSPDIYKYLNDYFFGIYPTWIFRVFEEGNENAKYICTSQMYDKNLVISQTGCFSTKDERTKSAYKIKPELGGTYFQDGKYIGMFGTTTLVPTKDIKKDLIFKLDYSNNKCPNTGLI